MKRLTSDYFSDIDAIPYEGPESDNPLAFKYYQPDKVVAGKTMKEHFRFAVCWWHSFVNGLEDPFGVGTRHFPWERHSDPMDRARERMDAAFDFFTKLGVPFYCFHDRDLAPAGESPAASEKHLQTMVELAADYQKETGVELLWGTANLFTHPRYANGAATNPDIRVVSHAAAQVKAALDATIRLGGANYVFWGGREGYLSLLNTDMKREQDHLGQFLRMARDYGRKAGFDGTFLIEPKPMEPTKHQYDYDAATVIGFLREQELDGDFKLNIETNHVTLAGHSLEHDLTVAAQNGLLGSIDANCGDAQNGWDTDYFPLDLMDAVKTMLILLEHEGLAPGGFNFDAKLRRNSTDVEDLFLAHIGGMDTLARGLLIADRIRENSPLLSMRKERYASFDEGIGARFERGELTLEELAKQANDGEPEMRSGKQEYLETLLMNHIR